MVLINRKLLSTALSVALGVLSASQAQAFTVPTNLSEANWIGSFESLFWQELYGSRPARSATVGSNAFTSSLTDFGNEAAANTISSFAEPDAVPPGAPVQLLALDNSNNLYQFSSDLIGGSTTVSISGLGGDTLNGIDVRPSNGLLYGFSNSSLYTISFTSSSASATFVSSLSTLFTGGSVSGVDFNPVADRLRAVGSNGQNLRINVDTGAVNVDTPVLFAGGATANIVAAAYTNNFGGAASTSLYGIDSLSDTLVLQNPPNAGTLTSIGAGLGFDFGSNSAFDILTLNGIDYTFASTGDDLYTIDLSTGVATALVDAQDVTGGTASFIGLVALPEPTTGGLAGFGALALLSRLRRRAKVS